MIISSRPNIVGTIDSQNPLITNIVAAIEDDTRSDVFYSEGPERERFDKETILHDEEAIKLIQEVKKEIIRVADVQEIRAFTYHREKVGDEERRWEKIFVNGEEMSVTEIWHLDGREKFLFSSFGDIASIEIVQGSVQVESDSAVEIRRTTEEAVQKGDVEVVSLPDGNIVYLNENTIHRRGLSRRNGFRHTLKVYV